MTKPIGPDDLRLYRLSRRLRQADVAEMMGVTPERVRQIETWPRPTEAAIARYLAAVEQALLVRRRR